MDDRPTGFAPIHGSPGTRVRFAGLLRLFWPFFLGIAAAGYLVRSAFPVPTLSPAVSGLALLALAGVTWWFHGRAVQRFGDFLKGARGEELVARELALLPGSFEVFHGLPNLAGGGDFDHVVVGPRGLAVVETKNWSGPVTHREGELLAQGRRPTRSPIAQVRREASLLREQLRQAGCGELRILPVVCLAGNTFEAEAREADEVTLCNARSLCAVLMRALDGQDATVVDPTLVLQALRDRIGGVPEA